MRERLRSLAGRLRAVPRPLAALLGATVILTTTWALWTPPFEAPDEFAHFGYTQHLAETGELPGTDAGGHRKAFSEEEVAAFTASQSSEVAGDRKLRTEWSEARYEQWRRDQARLTEADRKDGGGYDNPARTNPPLYYLYESIPYHLAGGGDLLSRFYLMRIFSGLLLLIAVAATWALIGEVFGRRPGLQLAGTALVALQPMSVFISASVTPDAAVIAVYAVSLWLGTRILKRGLTLGRAAAFAAVLMAGILVKATSYALAPGTALVLGVAALRAWRAGGREVVLRAGVAAGLALVPVLGWLAYTRVEDRPAVNTIGGGEVRPGVSQLNAIEYVWQFYLPRLPGMETLIAPPSIPAFDFWVTGGWAAFGWLEVTFPRTLYMVLLGVGIMLVVAAGFAVHRAWPRVDKVLLAFFALTVVALLSGLHRTELTIVNEDGEFFNQGRYLLPLLPIGGVIVAAAISLLNRRRAQLAAGLFVGALAGFQVLSLAVTAARFHVL